MTELEFQPWEPLLEGSAPEDCRAIVVIPARNEEAMIEATLDALAVQVDLAGQRMGSDSFEIVLLLNNCTDRSPAVASAWKRNHPEVQLQIVERSLPVTAAFVGHARRMLMDTAWRRLAGRQGIRGILSTDSDTEVSSDWIARNLAALAAGADAVGGVIALKDGEFALLPRGVRRAYVRDRRYQRLVAELEDRLDPQAGDPWPRHLEHFGASLACTPEIYARAGGLPAVTTLEDVAFVGKMWRVGARLRHDPGVKVKTSARVDGRVEVGLSGQLRLWQEMYEGGREQVVQTAAWLSHRFTTLARLRHKAAAKGIPAADYLADVDCDRLVQETFQGTQVGEIQQVNQQLAGMLRRLRQGENLTPRW